LELEPDAGEPADILAEAQALDIQVLDDPEEIEIAGYPALGITLQEASAGTTTVRRYVLVSPEAGLPFMLIMESSPERWEALQSSFEQVRARIRVGPSQE